MRFEDPNLLLRRVDVRVSLPNGCLCLLFACADLFIVECYEYGRAVSGHMNWTTLREKLAALGARKIMITHMNPSMLAKLEEVRASGVLIAGDGTVLEV